MSLDTSNKKIAKEYLATLYPNAFYDGNWSLYE